MNTLALLFSYNCKCIHKNCNIFIVSVGLLCQGTSMKVKNINLKQTSRSVQPAMRIPKYLEQVQDQLYN